ncbi:hypothetical protein Tco_0223588 [Tanacetum coccineum]
MIISFGSVTDGDIGGDLSLDCGVLMIVEVCFLNDIIAYADFIVGLSRFYCGVVTIVEVWFLNGTLCLWGGTMIHAAKEELYNFLPNAASTWEIDDQESVTNCWFGRNFHWEFAILKTKFKGLHKDIQAISDSGILKLSKNIEKKEKNLYSTLGVGVCCSGSIINSSASGLHFLHKWENSKTMIQFTYTITCDIRGGTP